MRTLIQRGETLEVRPVGSITVAGDFKAVPLRGLARKTKRRPGQAPTDACSAAIYDGRRARGGDGSVVRASDISGLGACGCPCIGASKGLRMTAKNRSARTHRQLQ